MLNPINEHHRARQTLLGICWIVSLGGCQIVSSNRPQMIHVQSAETENTAAQLNQEGIHYVQKTQLANAEALFNEAIAADSTYAPAYNNLGLVFYHQHDFYEAARAFTAAIENAPESPEPLNNLGLVMESVARPFEAIELYEQAHQLNPICAEYLANLLRARVRMKMVDGDFREKLHSLLLIEKRLEWQDWAREQLAMFNNPNHDRGPAKPSSDPLGELLNQPSSTLSTPLSSSSSEGKSPATQTESGNKSSNEANPSDEELRLHAPKPEELRRMEPTPLPPPLDAPPAMPALPGTPPLDQPSLFPTSTPSSSRRQSSILERLE